MLVTSIDPPSHGNDSDTVATIYGSNLDYVDNPGGAKLVWKHPQAIAPLPLSVYAGANPETYPNPKGSTRWALESVLPVPPTIRRQVRLPRLA